MGVVRRSGAWATGVALGAGGVGFAGVGRAGGGVAAACCGAAGAGGGVATAAFLEQAAEAIINPIAPKGRISCLIIS